MTRTTPSRPVDVAALFPELAPYRREATRLHPRRGEPTARVSAVGGPLLWPVSDPWPHCEHAHLDVGTGAPPLGPIPMVPVLQLFATDISGLPFPTGTDLLQLLWCPFDHEPYYSPRPQLRWRSSADNDTLMLGRPPHPEGARKDYIPAPCVLHPERIDEYPSWDIPRDLLDAMSVQFDALKTESGCSYQYDLAVAPGIKVGGYPNWTQDPDWPHCADCGSLMEHLLTIDSAEFDGGTAKAWLPKEDRPATGSVFDLPYKARSAIQNAHGLMIGDMGGVYLFVCTHCPDRPYAYRSDCS